MLTILFLSFVAVMVILVVALCARYLGGHTAMGIATALAVWLLYVGSIGYFGLIRNFAMRPPGAVFLFVPVVAFLLFFILRMRSDSAVRVALAFPLALLLGTQVFRVIVELSSCTSFGTRASSQGCSLTLVPTWIFMSEPRRLSSHGWRPASARVCASR